MAPRSPASDTSLTRERLDRLLRALSDDEAAAAERYALLVRRLVAYFGWQRCADAERLADEVVDRVARRLAEGEPVTHVGAYALGVARLVAKEARARLIRDERRARDYAQSARRDGGGDEPALRCLDRCLERLGADRRHQLLEYYTQDTASRIEQRRRLADRLGVAPTALRNRMLRMRQDLEGCVGRCLALQDATAAIGDAAGDIDRRGSRE
jgi:hypothetical protein